MEKTITVNSGLSFLILKTGRDKEGGTTVIGAQKAGQIVRELIEPYYCKLFSATLIEECATGNYGTSCIL